MLSKDELLKMALRQDDKANKAFYNYQETGIPRYDREHRNAEDLADALRMAANAADDHALMVTYKMELVNLVQAADKALTEGSDGRSVLESIVAKADWLKVRVSYQKEEQA